MVVSVGPYRFSNCTRLPNTSIQRFTSAGSSASPANTTHFSALKYPPSSFWFSSDRNTEGTHCSTSMPSTSIQSASRPASSTTLRDSGAHTVPPPHSGTNTSFKNPSNDG